jgi:hypothetical protein
MTKLGAMTHARYRLKLAHSGKYYVERTKPGESLSTACDFATQHAARSWIDHDKVRRSASAKRRHSTARRSVWWVRLWWPR